MIAAGKAPASLSGSDMTPLLCMWLVALVIRSWNLDACGLSHFDEGVYAFGGHWPEQPFYSPPAYPWLVGLFHNLAGSVRDTHSLVISAFAGSLLAPAAWLLARELFSNPLGIGGTGSTSMTPIVPWLSGCLVAIEPVLIDFSRVGLTDSLFTTSFVFSVFLAIRAIRLESVKLAICAGLATGFTWNCKYNGPLPLVLSAVFVVTVPLWRHPKRWALFCILALIAGLAYLPWAWHIEQTVGYANLARHHGGYFQGLVAAPTNLVKIERMADVFSRKTSLAYCATAVLSLVFPGSIQDKAIRCALMLTLVGKWAPMPHLAQAGLLAVGFVQLGRNIGFARSAWLLGVPLVLPALYSPYFRLWLPAFGLFAITEAAGLATFVTYRRAPQYQGKRSPFLLVAGVLAPGLFSLAFFSGPNGIPPFFPQTESTPGYRNAADQLREWLKANGKTPTILARPPLAFYLASRGVAFRRLAEGGVANLALGANDVLVVDAAVFDTRGYEAFQTDGVAGWRQLVAFEIEPSTITRLDDEMANPERSPKPLIRQIRVFTKS